MKEMFAWFRRESCMYFLRQISRQLYDQLLKRNRVKDKLIR